MTQLVTSVSRCAFKQLFINSFIHAPTVDIYLLTFYFVNLYDLKSSLQPNNSTEMF